MDVLLEEILQNVKDRVEVLGGENPVLHAADAIRLAERNNLLYRYAQNGATYEVRWNPSGSVFLYQEAEISMVICKRIIANFDPKKPAKVTSEPTPKVASPSKSTPPKPKTTSKSTPTSTSKSIGKTTPTKKTP